MSETISVKRKLFLSSPVGTTEEQIDFSPKSLDEAWELFDSRRFLHGHRESTRESFMVIFRDAFASAPTPASDIAALRGALERIAEASPRSTNSWSAEEAFSWCSAVAETALENGALQHVAKGERG